MEIRIKVGLVAFAAGIFFTSGYAVAGGTSRIGRSPIIQTLSITPATLTAATVGVNYNQTLTLSAPGSLIWNWAVSANVPGLKLVGNNATSVLEGTPSTAGSYSFTIEAYNNVNAKNASQTYTLVVNPAGTTPSPTPSPSGNLIANPGLELATINPELPDHWNTDNWGTNTAIFNYPVAGKTGNGVNVQITAYPDSNVDVGGDAKWWFDNVSVTPGIAYLFSDDYKSNVESVVTVQYASTLGALSYQDIVTLESTNDAWVTMPTQTITPPAGTAEMTVLHLIHAVGSLTTDNYSLALATATTTPPTTPPPSGPPPPTTNSNEFPVGILTFSVHDIWKNQLDAAAIFEAAGIPVTYEAITYVLTNPNNPLAFTITPNGSGITIGGAYTAPIQNDFSTTGTYTTSAGTATNVKATITYTPVGDVEKTIPLGSGTISGGTNLPLNLSFTLLPRTPSTPIAINLIPLAGGITVSNAVLNETLGHMSPADLLARSQKGNKISPHGVYHCLEGLLANNPGLALTDPATVCPDFKPGTSRSVEQEITQSQATLAGFGIPVDDTHAFPHESGPGTGAEGILKANGICAAIGSDPGHNIPSSDPWAFLTNNMDITVTSFSTVQGWIDDTVTNKVHRDISLHETVDSFATLEANGMTYGTTLDMVQQTVDYVKPLVAAGKLKVMLLHDFVHQYFPACPSVQ